MQLLDDLAELVLAESQLLRDVIQMRLHSLDLKLLTLGCHAPLQSKVIIVLHFQTLLLGLHVLPQLCTILNSIELKAQALNE